MAYQIELTDGEVIMARWLDDHGYLGDFFRHAHLIESTEDGATANKYELAEHEAWAVQEYVNDDPHAFLACNGLPSLADKMWQLLDSIV